MMKISRKTLGIVIALPVSVLILLASPFFIRHFLDSKQTPEQQLAQLTVKANNEIDEILGSHTYSLQNTDERCLNQGQSEFFAFGRDTVWCIYGVDVHSELNGHVLRSLIEANGWKRKLYEDGSGSEYNRWEGPFICSLYDGNTYHSRKEAEETYVDGFFKINCQSYTHHYDSPLPPPDDSRE
jgi:hypothetical protein